MSEREFAIVPGAEPYAAPGGPIGVLLVHGFTGSPASMVPWAKDLQARGHAVRVPRLPGHGTSWKDLLKRDWQEWYDEADAALSDLRGTCTTVAVCALSMGGALALRLAQQREVDSLVLVNPALIVKWYEGLAKIIHPVIPLFPGIGNDIKKPGQDEAGYTWTPVRAGAQVQLLQAEVRADLAKVTAPTLLFRSRDDHVVNGRGRDLILRTMPEVEYVELVDSFHVATLDNEAGLIFERSAPFIESHLATDV